MANTNPPSKISKSRRIKRFDEDISQLSLSVYASHLNVSLLYMISQEVVSSLKNHSKISHSVHYPKNLRVATSSSYILGLGGRLGNRRLFARRPTNKRRFEKMTSIRSALSVNPTTRKINIEKANKIK
jgi:hypothetical protein